MIYGAPNPGTKFQNPSLKLVFNLISFVISGFDVLEVFVPMRDGVTLYTKIWTPRNISLPLPILLNRTPYGTPEHRNSDGWFQGMMSYWQFNVEGFILVIQDIRGRHKSAGEFTTFHPPGQPAFSNSVDEASDAFDTIDWLVKNVKLNNGKVGQFGVRPRPPPGRCFPVHALTPNQSTALDIL